jgi:hypothetical protein
VSFVHGHARAAGWVVTHVRRPNRPEAGQLPLLTEAVLTEGAVPASRLPGNQSHRPGRGSATRGSAPELPDRPETDATPRGAAALW